MREISTEYMDLLSNVRTVGARLTFRDTRLIFNVFSPGESNLPSMDNPHQWDACTYHAVGDKDTKIFRVARNSAGYLCYQNVLNPSVTPWPDWVVTTHLLSDCRPSVVPAGPSNIPYYHVQPGVYIYAVMELGDANPHFVRFQWAQAGLSGPQQLNTFQLGSFAIGQPPSEDYEFNENTGIAVAAIDSTRFLAQFFPYNTVRGVNYSVIQYFEEQTNGTWLMNEFRGAVYGDMQDPYRFDAEELNDMIYVFSSDSDYGRPIMFRTYPKVLSSTYLINEWSDGEYIFPLDVLDDTSFFKLGAVSVIDNKMWVTGRIKRGSGIEMDVYMYGDGNFSLGRDMFIANSDEIPLDSSGKMLLAGDIAYYVGHGVYAKAEATTLVGVDALDKKLVTIDTHGFGLNARANDPWGFRTLIRSDLEHVAIRNNGEVTVDAGLKDDADNWEWAQLGVFGIDAILRDYFSEGNEQQIMTRGKGMKRLGQWTSDAFYDYWSQAKLDTDPADLSEVVRASGYWSADDTMEETPLRMDRLNDRGILYTVAKASRNGQCSARFYLPDEEEWEQDIMKGQFGVGINYYRESKGEAAVRLDKASIDVTENEFGDNGIFALYDMDRAEIVLYVVRDSVWTEVDSVSASVPTNEWIWIMIKFNEGFVQVFTGSGTNPSWTVKIEYRFDTNVSTYNIEPWFRDQRGRGAIAVQNISAHSTTPGFTSTSSVIPVEDTSPFPSSGRVIVDSELIDYASKTAVGTTLTSLTLNWADGTTYKQAPHENDLWTNVKIYHIDWTPGNAGEIALGSSKNYALGITQAFQGPYGLDRIDKIRIVMKRIGVPTMPVYAWIVNDDFDNAYYPDVGVGRWDQPRIQMVSAPKAGNTLPTEYDWVDFDMTVTPESMRWLWPEYPRGYFIFVTTIPPYFVSQAFGYNYYRSWDSYDDPSNYYMVKLDDTVSATTGVWLGWSVNSGWDTAEQYFGRDTMMPFEIYGIGNTPSEGYEIYIDGYLPEKPRGALDGAALVVTDGPGKGTVFGITDYDWRAPRQWVTSRTYFPPDKMEDHIGDPLHGSWVDSNLSRIFVDRNPYGALSEGSVFKIYSSLVVGERGVSDTSPTAHPSGTVSLYTPLSVFVDRVKYFSGEVDMRLEDMAKELCAKAGVLDFSAGKDYSGVFSLVNPTDYTVEWMPGERRHGIVKMSGIDTSSLAEYGVIFRSDAADINSATQYYMLEVFNGGSQMNLRLGIKNGGDVEWIEYYPMPYDEPLSEWTFSFQENYFSVWLNRKHIHTFSDDTLSTGEYCGVFGINIIGDINVDWSKVDIRVDNYVLDLGYRGDQLLSGLIGPKKVIFGDTQYGGIFMDRAKTSGAYEYALADLTIEAAKTEFDSKRINRVRAEGAEIAEVVNWESIRQDGNLFLLVNATEANDEWETANEAEFIINDLRASVNTHSIDGVADPRVEPNDIIRARSTDGFRDIVVDSIAMSMRISRSDVLFDMSIEGRNAE